MWRGAGKHYDNVKKILTPGSPVCSCVTDIENNGLMMYLEQIAETLDQHGKTLSLDVILLDYWRISWTLIPTLLNFLSLVDRKSKL